MFPWPKYGGLGDWGGLVGALAWYARILAGVIRWLPGGVAGFIRWLAGRMASFIRGMNPARPGSLMKWVLVGVFVAMSLAVWDALTVQWLLSLTRR